MDAGRLGLRCGPAFFGFAHSALQNGGRAGFRGLSGESAEAFFFIPLPNYRGFVIFSLFLWQNFFGLSMSFGLETGPEKTS